MSGRSCQLADVWMAALQGGSLDEASGIRLDEHLQSCEACSRRARVIDGLVHRLRERSAEGLREAHVQRLWRDLRSASGRREDVGGRSSVRTWRLALAAAVLLGVLGGGLIARWILHGGEGEQSEVRVATRAPSWRTVAASGAALEPGTRPGPGRLVVGPRGRVVLASESHVVILYGGASVSVGASVELHRGRLAAASLRPGRSGELVVRAGSLRVRPLGTAFAVTRTGGGAPRVEVTHGRVEVTGTSDGRAVVVSAGLAWRGTLDLVDPRVFQELGVDLSQARRLMRPKEAVAAATGAASMPTASAPGQDVSPAPRPAPARVVRVDVVAEVGAIERLIAAGQGARARTRARRLLRSPAARRHAPALRTLVAEAHLQQREYRRARVAYLRTWRSHPRSTQGGDALYAAAGLTLERLGDARAAVKHYERYLASYRRGPHRQGAYLMLCRALQRRGERAAARRVARRYLAEFPRGQFARIIEKITGTGQR